MYRQCRAALGIASLSYSGSTVTGLIDPRTGLAVTGVPVYTWSAANVSATLTANAGTPVLVSDIASTVSGSYSLWIVNAAGTAMTPLCTPIYLSANLPAAGAGNSGWEVFVSDYGPTGAKLRSDGTIWKTIGGIARIYNSGQELVLTSPAATFTGFTVVNNGGFVQIQAAGIHGLTTASVVTPGLAYIEITAGTGWTVGLHSIKTVDSVNNLTLNTPYVAQSATGLAVTPINTEVTIASVTIPTLTANSVVRAEYSVQAINTANAKTLNLKWGGVTFNTTAYANAAIDKVIHDLRNRNDVGKQVGDSGLSTTNEYATNNTAPVTGAFDTGSATTTLLITLQAGTAALNERFGLNGLRVSIMD